MEQQSHWMSHADLGNIDDEEVGTCTCPYPSSNKKSMTELEEQLALQPLS